MATIGAAWCGFYNDGVKCGLHVVHNLGFTKLGLFVGYKGDHALGSAIMGFSESCLGGARCGFHNVHVLCGLQRLSMVWALQ